MKTDLLDRYSMLPQGSRVLCAVSGGADSMCLLHWLKSLEETREIRVLAAHFEHGIRGEESQRDCDFVQQWCRQEGIPCFAGHGDVPGFAAENHLGLEEAARLMRYAFLEQTAAEQSCDVIATAHNADDNAETMLFHLARGAGSAGLAGIPPVRGKIIRPLLFTQRWEIEQYLQLHNIPHVEDSTNRSDDYARNRIRHQVLPALREVNEAFVTNAGSAAELLREDETFLSGLAEEFIHTKGKENSVPCGELLNLPAPVRTRVVRSLAGTALSRTHVEAVLLLAGGKGLGFADVPGMRVRRDGGWLYFGGAKDTAVLPRIELIPGTSAAIPGSDLLVCSEKTVFSPQINSPFTTYQLKCANITGPLLLTGKEPGDSMRPQGRNCTKSLKSLFLEHKINVRDRELTPVIRDDAGVLAVLNCVDERAAAGPGDEVIKIQIINNREKEK
ncbi:MAG: tRNA lysidine(34) synthetase TilS [Oscillospiraceae bacterium]|nr:tRNA lysidine(34) synthetase TilS [Oscillospiraceae bacterium]